MYRTGGALGALGNNFVLVQIFLQHGPRYGGPSTRCLLHDGDARLCHVDDVEPSPLISRSVRREAKEGRPAGPR